MNHFVTRNLAVASVKPPTQFRLFVKGWNDTENGRYLFDETAAASVMAAYKKWGVDLAIDLEHQMLEEGIASDPTAKDARGWCNLELRDDGSLWAVNVKWTEDGAARLTEKRQRYISPAFAYDEKTRRVSQIVNMAITAMPATHETPALVAARRPPIAPSSASSRSSSKVDPVRVDAAMALLRGLDPPARRRALSSSAGRGMETMIRAIVRESVASRGARR